MLNVKSLEINGVSHVVTYDAEHTTPGRDGTCLTFPIQVLSFPAGNTVRTKIDIAIDCETVDGQEVAFDRLASYLERMAIAIRERGKPTAFVFSYPEKASQENHHEQTYRPTLFA